MTSRLLISLLKNQNGDKLQKNVEKKNTGSCGIRTHDRRAGHIRSVL
jgi:hypothetical protein